ncbi:MAG: 4-(cytidine 5'-diphospho)-2-C-methyl-D-erythritol kinase [Ignavibacteria bacterium]|nr:4-(cytidine 5'-diphospho)-2-C-methyl-D-erythritol kinase [Ignavibacteria bacterium]
MLSIKSFGKINLGLEILGKRDDGFHNINSIFLPITLSDILTFETSEKFNITISPKSIKISKEENLIYKTICLIQNKYKININKIKVHLKKKIPIGAGLGGGSSNASATITGIDRIFGLNLSLTEKLSLAKEIGSDVTFFLYSKPAIVRGIGDIITPLDNLNLNFIIILIYPNFTISTKYAYSLFKNLSNKQPTDYLKILNNANQSPLILRDYFSNDFEQIIFPKFPILSEIKSKLLNAGAFYSSLSGSGSTVYGLFEKEFNPTKILQEFSNFQTFVAEPLISEE